MIDEIATGGRPEVEADPEEPVEGDVRVASSVPANFGAGREAIIRSGGSNQGNILDNMRWQVILATWDEYAVCRIAGSIGYDPAEGYLETLVKVLGDTRGQCYELIKAYRTHGDVGQIVGEVYGKLGDLLEYSSYFVGAATAQETPETHPPALTDEAEFGWFAPFYERLIEVHEALWSEFGKMGNLDAFEAIGDILENMAESIGAEASRESDDLIKFNIPYRPESMPDIAMTNPLMRALLGR